MADSHRIQKHLPESSDAEGVDKPHRWESAVLAAYVRMLGGTQRAAANLADVGKRTVRRWENSKWWPDAEAEAHRRWLQKASAKARLALLEVLDDMDPETRDGATLRFVSERLLSGLEPPKLRQEITGKDGGPIEVSDAREQLAAKLVEIKRRRNEDSEGEE